MMRTREVSGQIWYILLHSVISFFGRVPGLLDIYIYIYMVSETVRMSLVSWTFLR